MPAMCPRALEISDNKIYVSWFLLHNRLPQKLVAANNKHFLFFTILAVSGGWGRVFWSGLAALGLSGQAWPLSHV